MRSRSDHKILSAEVGAPKALWLQVWLILYAATAIFAPPIHFHGKNYFCAELLLAPLLAVFVRDLIRHRFSLRPPKILLAVGGACILAFVSGIFRGDTSKTINIYDNLTNDNFSVAKDGVVLIRWVLIFFTPWIAAVVFRKSGFNSADFFWNAVKWSALVSALLSFADHLHLISLENWGYYVASLYWPGRSYGTQASPLEAGLLYGGALVYVARQNRVLALIFFVALGLTHCGTAFIALTVLMLAAACSTQTSARVRWGFLACAFLALALVDVSFSPAFLAQKLRNVRYRADTWLHFLALIPQKPWILLTGVGFSAIVVDNSFFLLLIKGGVLLLACAAAWIKKLFSYVPRDLKPVFFFWFLTFLDLDSIGYWTLGRLCWLTLGLCYSSHLVTAEDVRTLHSAPRGSTPP